MLLSYLGSLKSSSPDKQSLQQQWETDPWSRSHPRGGQNYHLIYWKLAAHPKFNMKCKVIHKEINTINIPVWVGVWSVESRRSIVQRNCHIVFKMHNEQVTTGDGNLVFVSAHSSIKWVVVYCRRFNKQSTFNHSLPLHFKLVQHSTRRETETINTQTNTPHWSAVKDLSNNSKNYTKCALYTVTGLV